MYRYTGVTEMDGAMGSIYSENLVVDRSHLVSSLASSHLISSHHTTNYALYLF